MPYVLLFNAIVYLLLAVLITILVIRAIKGTEKTATKEAKKYSYFAKKSIMTKIELQFYEKLLTVLGEKYYIVPQAHLGTFLDHKVKGQNWKGAFSVINRKSVDFLICDKITSEPKIAIELDDWSHGREDRIARDELVNRIIDESGILLVRYRAGEWNTPADILEKISKISKNKSN